MSDDPASITFSCAVYRVQTLADGGIRVTLDLPEDATAQMAMLAECQRFGRYMDAKLTQNVPNGPDTDE